MLARVGAVSPEVAAPWRKGLEASSEPTTGSGSPVSPAPVAALRKSRSALYISAWHTRAAATSRRRTTSAPGRSCAIAPPDSPQITPAGFASCNHHETRAPQRYRVCRIIDVSPRRQDNPRIGSTDANETLVYSRDMRNRRIADCGTARLCLATTFYSSPPFPTGRLLYAQPTLRWKVWSRQHSGVRSTYGLKRQAGRTRATPWRSVAQSTRRIARFDLESIARTAKWP